MHVDVEGPSPVEAASILLFEEWNYITYEEDLRPPVLIAFQEQHLVVCPVRPRLQPSAQCPAEEECQVEKRRKTQELPCVHSESIREEELVAISIVDLRALVNS